MAMIRRRPSPIVPARIFDTLGATYPDRHRMTTSQIDPSDANAQSWRDRLRQGLVIPACPLALRPDGQWSQRHQRAVIRYYLESGAGGLAVGVHSTQFAIRDPRHGLFEPLLRFAAETMDAAGPAGFGHPIKIAGICGATPQAIGEAKLAVSRGYHAGLLSLAAVASRPEASLLEHCREVAGHIPLIGFYLQPAVGGRVLSYRFWREFAEIESVVAIKIAPFDRYRTLDVIRAVADSGRDDIALYTGNDDNILIDLLTPFPLADPPLRIVGGLLGQWGVWTRRAVEMFDDVRRLRQAGQVPAEWLGLAAAVTDANAAIFDAAHDFSGCIPGILEILRRQGLVPSTRCLDPDEQLSPGQAEEIDRVIRAYPKLNDDAFVRANIDRWFAD